MTPATEKAAPIPAEVRRAANACVVEFIGGPVGRDQATALRDIIERAILADREARPSLPDSREERGGEDEPVMWRRRGKYKWFYRESPPTSQSGTGWLPLYARARARQGGNNG